MVTLVAYKLERQWLCELYFGMEDYNCIRQPKSNLLHVDNSISIVNYVNV